MFFSLTKTILPVPPVLTHQLVVFPLVVLHNQPKTGSLTKKEKHSSSSPPFSPRNRQRRCPWAAMPRHCAKSSGRPLAPRWGAWRGGSRRARPRRGGRRERRGARDARNSKTCPCWLSRESMSLWDQIWTYMLSLFRGQEGKWKKSEGNRPDLSSELCSPWPVIGRRRSSFSEAATEQNLWHFVMSLLLGDVGRPFPHKTSPPGPTNDGQ